MTDGKKIVSKEEAEAMATTVSTSGWPIFSRWIADAKQTAIVRCCESPNDQRYFQGIVAGVSEIEKFVKYFTEFAAQKNGE